MVGMVNERLVMGCLNRFIDANFQIVAKPSKILSIASGGVIVFGI